MKTNEIIINNNITLRPIRKTDAVDIFNTIDSQRDYLGKWLPFVAFTNEISFTQAFVDSLVEVPDEGKSAHVFTMRYNDIFAGLAGIQNIDAGNLKAEIGYWLHEELQGKGIVTQSVMALCSFGFNELGLNRIYIKCATENSKSSAIPKRLGFLFEGIERQGELQPDGTFYDLEVYSMLKNEWQP